jgi:hypothetical protein
MRKDIGPTSLISYVSFTLIFFIVKSKFGFEGTSWIWIFLIFTGIVQFVNNLYITQYPEICGSYNITSALTSTIVPWIFIFGLSCVCLIYIPGWLRVFSNTIGATIANMVGLSEAVNHIFKPIKSTGSDTDDLINETANLLYTNRNSFINEINMDYQKIGPNVSWESLDNILKFMKLEINDIGQKNQLYEDLYKKLSLKEDIGYFFWFILVGSISVVVSTNSILLSSCNSVEFNF